MSEKQAANPELTDQDLDNVVGGTGSAVGGSTTLGPSGPSSVSPPKATVIGAGSDSSNPGFTVDPFTGTSTGQIK
jgi:hypothetical protein